MYLIVVQIQEPVSKRVLKSALKCTLCTIPHVLRIKNIWISIKKKNLKQTRPSLTTHRTSLPRRCPLATTSASVFYCYGCHGWLRPLALWWMVRVRSGSWIFNTYYGKSDEQNRANWEWGQGKQTSSKDLSYSFPLSLSN